MPASTTNKRACDRCHAVKERCHWEADRPACLRCARLSHDCHLRRPLQKVGRKSRGRRMLNVSEHTSYRRGSESTNSSGMDSSSSGQSSPPSPTEVSTPPSFVQPQSPPREMALFGCLTPMESDILRLCFGAPEAVGRYTLGPTFHSQHQRALMTQLYSAFPQLKDAFLSCAPVLASHQNAHLPDAMEKFCYSRAATAISSFRYLEVNDRHDLPVSLALGVGILTFSMCVSGGETFTLARYTLGLIKPCYEMNSILDSDETSYLICLVLAETTGCLLKADVPTLRFQRGELGDSVDRFLGVSYPLLAHLYDLCEVNHSLCHGNGYCSSETVAALDSVETVVRRWEPTYPVDFLECYEHDEVVNIRTQAKALRLAILIIVHRLRHPYGTQDEKAMLLAKSIMTELERAMQVTEHSVKCTDLCLMVASLEQVDGASRWQALDMVDRLLQFSRSFRLIIKRQLKTFWAARDGNNGIYWFHLNRYWEANLAH